mgnify:CR=1 FL=1
MALIPAESLDAIRARLSIEELAGEYIPRTQRAGRNLKACCPFHQERTPSFIISPERQTFHCFGCGEHGDVFTFLMKMENLSFSEAVEKLAQRAGVKIEAAELGPAERERLKLKELLEYAAGYYNDFLLRSPQAAPGRAYFSGRKVSSETVEKFKLGYAAKSGTLHVEAQKKGFTKDQLLKAGLAAESKQEAGRLRDYFYDRVLYPIRDPKGAVVGFGARTLGDGMPKYLNSPDSPVFSKSRVLYGLPEGLPAIRKARKLLLMEGYMDVMAAHQHGLTLACAPLGTALTPEHAALVKRFADSVVIVFDADSAGLNAAIRGAEILLAAGLSVRIASVPEGKDPDEHLHNFGVSSFEKCLAAAADLVEFKTELLLKGQKFPLSADAKSSVAKAVLATIAQSPDEILKDEWIRRLAQRLGLHEESLRKAEPKAQAPARPLRPAAPKSAAADSPLPAGDLQILSLVFKEPSLAKLVGEEELASPAARRIRAALEGMQAASGAQDWSSKLMERLEEGDRAAASRLLIDDKTYLDPEETLTALLDKRRWMKRLKELEPEVLAMGSQGKPVREDLKQEYMRLLTQLKGTKR